jgi:hypothetical protein
LLRVFEHERCLRESFLLDLLVGGPEPPGYLRLRSAQMQGSSSPLLTVPWLAIWGEGVRLYRLFALPMDLRAVDDVFAEVLRRAGDPHGDELLPMKRMVALCMGFLSGPLIGNIIVVHDKTSETQTSERLAVAALAVYRYRAELGKYPKTLMELVPRYLSAVPEDARLGLPLSYEWAKDGAAIFSQRTPRRPREREPSGDGEPPWKSLRKTRPRLVFLLGAFREEELAEDTVDFEEEEGKEEGKDEEEWEEESVDEEDSGGTGRP